MKAQIAALTATMAGRHDAMAAQIAALQAKDTALTDQSATVASQIADLQAEGAAPISCITTHPGGSNQHYYSTTCAAGADAAATAGAWATTNSDHVMVPGKLVGYLQVN
jgi:hypothetical protein